MTKIFTRGLITSFIITAVFALGFLIPQAPVQAQTMSLCQTIEALIAAGVIPPVNADAARASGGCVVDPNQVTINVASSTIGLTYDKSGDEALLTAEFNVSLTAGSSDFNLYTDVASAVLLDQNNNQVQANSLRARIDIGMGEKTDSYGRNYAIIPAGTTVPFTVVYTANPKELFAGYYHAKLNEIYSLILGQIDLVSNIVSANQTNSIVIVGETSPYITSVTSSVSVGDPIVVTGARFNNSSPTGISHVFIDNAIQTFGYTVDATTIRFNLPELSAGWHSLQYVNDYGASNITSFNVVISSTTPSINVLSPNGSEVWMVGSSNNISWNDSGDIVRNSNVQIGLIDTRYNTESGPRAEQIIAYSIPNTHNYTWKIPSVLGTMDLTVATSAIYKISVHSWATNNGQAIGDSSQSPFSIVGSMPIVDLKYQIKGNSNFSDGPAVLAMGTELIMQWSSKNAVSCSASWSPSVTTTNGLVSVGLVNTSTTYTVTCKNSTGQTASDSVIVNIGPAKTATGSLSPAGSIACTNTAIPLSWANVFTGAPASYNLRVDDQSNGWTGSCTSVNAGDLCKNNLPGNVPLYSFLVQAGHSYHFWVETSDGQSKSGDFSVQSCNYNEVPVVPVTPVTPVITTPVVTPDVTPVNTTVTPVPASTTPTVTPTTAPVTPTRVPILPRRQASIVGQGYAAVLSAWDSFWSLIASF